MSNTKYHKSKFLLMILLTIKNSDNDLMNNSSVCISSWKFWESSPYGQQINGMYANIDCFWSIGMLGLMDIVPK